MPSGYAQGLSLPGEAGVGTAQGVSLTDTTYYAPVSGVAAPTLGTAVGIEGGTDPANAPAPAQSGLAGLVGMGLRNPGMVEASQSRPPIDTGRDACAVCRLTPAASLGAGMLLAALGSLL